MKKYNVFIKEMRVKMVYRVEANNEQEAIKIAEDNRLNCGEELGGDYFGEFKVDHILEVKDKS